MDERFHRVDCPTNRVEPPECGRVPRISPNSFLNHSYRLKDQRPAIHRFLKNPRSETWLVDLDIPLRGARSPQKHAQRTELGRISGVWAQEHLLTPLELEDRSTRKLSTRKKKYFFSSVCVIAGRWSFKQHFRLMFYIDFLKCSQIHQGARR